MKRDLTSFILELLTSSTDTILQRFDAQTINISRIDNLNLHVRVVPSGSNAPRYFTIKVSESL